MPDQTVASVKPVRASRRRGKAEDDAEIKDVPSAGTKFNWKAKLKLKATLQ